MTTGEPQSELRGRGRILAMHQRLALPEGPGQQTGGLLPFEVSSFRWALRFEHIDRLLLCAAIEPVWPGAGLPPAVVGMVASDAEVLTVVDTAVLMGYPSIKVTPRSRLLVMQEGPLKGVALLVGGVFESVNWSECSEEKTSEPLATAILDAGGIRMRVTEPSVLSQALSQSSPG